MLAFCAFGDDYETRPDHPMDNCGRSGRRDIPDRH
jgi:hypothetical protein